MTTQNAPNSASRFSCKTCDYYTCKKSSYTRHISSTKHLATTIDAKNTINSSEKEPHVFTCNCGNKYKHHSSLWKHRKTCDFKKEVVVTPLTDASNNLIIPCEMFMQLMKQNSEFKELMMDQNKHMVSLFEKGGMGNTTNNNTNSHNKTKFNMNFFLNEQCKDAMNIMDFVNTMQLQLSDLERVGEQGYVKGISHIVINKLKDLEIHKRPIHCSDLKRETMYVKDEDAWEKDEKKEKLSKMITHVSHKNQKQIGSWQEKNPEYKDSESVKSEEYLKIVGESMNGLTNDDESDGYTNKIIKNIAKEVTVKEE